MNRSSFGSAPESSRCFAAAASPPRTAPNSGVGGVKSGTGACWATTVTAAPRSASARRFIPFLPLPQIRAGRPAGRDHSPSENLVRCGLYGHATNSASLSSPCCRQLAGEPSPRCFRSRRSAARISCSPRAGTCGAFPAPGAMPFASLPLPALETDPSFSPDGTKIAFTGQYEGNLDIYVVDAGGGDPKRLTWHPAEDNAVGWTPDGKNILFRSGRYRERRLFTVPAEGGPTAELPFPEGRVGASLRTANSWCICPSALTGRRMRSMRGNATAAVALRPIWIAQLSDSAITARVPRDNSNDSYPMWVGNRSTSSPTATAAGATLYSFDIKSQKVTRLLSRHGPTSVPRAQGPAASCTNASAKSACSTRRAGRIRPFPFGSPAILRPFARALFPLRRRSAPPHSLPRGSVLCLKSAAK